MSTAADQQDPKRQKTRQYEYDLVVIGGGSGGLAASKEAVKVSPNSKVAVLDFVQPSPYGTKWGLGGTCVNVGCVPKKLMHHAGLLGASIREEAAEYGWEGLDKVSHNWNTLRSTVNDYIKSLNFSYKVGLKSAGVTYIEGYAKFEDQHTLSWVGGGNKSGKLTSENFLLATGGRPYIDNWPGKELCITSDDLFWLKKPPGKRVLVIGAGYIALECAGFLHHLGSDVTMMVRGEFMRKFDAQCAAQIGEVMERSGVRFVMPASPVRFRKTTVAAVPSDATAQPDGTFKQTAKDGSVKVFHPSGAVYVTKAGKSSWQIPDGSITVEYVFNGKSGSVQGSSGEQKENGKQVLTDEFDAVFVAIGRSACVEDLALDKVGVQLKDRKVLVDADHNTTAKNIFALGDMSTGKDFEVPELTPSAIQAGLYLARRLFGQGKERMDYTLVPTTVFSPVEYGYVGLTQEQAEHKLGKENVEVFWSRYGSLEQSPLHAHEVPLRSRHFVGVNQWTRRYQQQHKLWWADCGLDKDARVRVLAEQTGQKDVLGDIVKRYQDAQGNWVYDVMVLADQTPDNKETLLTSLPAIRLELHGMSLENNNELWLKATCLAKLVCDKKADNKVIGIHFIGPNAGEVMQGFSMALHFGATKAHFDKLTGIHPTAAEEFTVLTGTKTSGASFLKKAGCGGGSCG